MKNEKGFTLIEMMIVLMIISTLLLVTIPNVTNSNSVIKDKGCEALVRLVEAQVQAYEIKEEKAVDKIDTLIEGDYISTNICPNGDVIEVVDGEVKPPAPPPPSGLEEPEE